MTGVVDEVLIYQIRLDHLGTRQLRLMAGSINGALEEIMGQIEAREGQDGTFTFDRYKAMQRELEAVRRALAERLSGTAAEGVQAVADTVLPATEKAFKASEVEVFANFVRPNLDLISQATARDFDDARWPQWGERLANNTVQRLSSELREAAFLGEGIPSIRKRFEKVGNLSRTSAQRLARTSINAASNRGRMAVMEANKDIAPEWRYISTLDLKTGLICIGLDQQVFKVGDPDSPLPPRHPSCRGVAVPKVKGAESLGERPSNPVSEKALLREFTEKEGLGTITKRANLPHGTKGQFDAFRRERTPEIVGRVKATTSYEQWLGRQPAAIQKEALGSTRYRAWKNGVPVTAFATSSREISIAELRRLYPSEMDFVT